jgi:hypothetical protein
MRKTKEGKPALGWKKMMKKKTARVIVLSGTRPFFIYMLFGDYTNEISRGILGFAGYHVSLTRLGPTDGASDRMRAGWKKKIEGLGRRGI